MEAYTYQSRQRPDGHRQRSFSYEDDSRRQRRQRPRSPESSFEPRTRRRSPRRRDFSEQPQPRSAIPKAAIAVGLIALASAVYHMWSKRDAEREAKRRSDRRRHFEMAKARRRREEEEQEKKQDEDSEFEELRRRGRRIEYTTYTPSSERSISGSPRRLEAPRAFRENDVRNSSVVRPSAPGAE